MQIPLDVTNIAPGPGFTRLPAGTRLDGLPDGVHTGGCWLSPDGAEVWKPLDAKPYVNATCRVSTAEAQCLEEMAGQPGFPRNWRVEHTGVWRDEDGDMQRRAWLVRKRARLMPQDTAITIEQALEIEQALRTLNQAGWEIGDAIQVALDEEGNVFILDLSTAHKYGVVNYLYCNEDHRILNWFKELGFLNLMELRERGNNVFFEELLLRRPAGMEDPRDYQYIYASCRRPISADQAQIEGAFFIDAQNKETDQVRIYTWVVVPEPLDEATIAQYELTWAWSPIDADLRK